MTNNERKKSKFALDKDSQQSPWISHTINQQKHKETNWIEQHQPQNRPEKHTITKNKSKFALDKDSKQSPWPSHIINQQKQEKSNWIEQQQKTTTTYQAWKR